MTAPRQLGRVWIIAPLVALVALVALGGSARAAEAVATPPPPPLTNEDIVRMVASGTTEREILDTIRAREEAFDLSNDMVEELSLAGVPAAVVTAMRQKHAGSAPPEVPAARPTRSRLPVVVNLGGDASIRVPAWADEDARAKLRLPKENDQRVVKDLAVFLACISAEHVPDLWRSKSPLGRDMDFATRHEMLAFVAGDTPAGKNPRLTLPARLEAEIDDSEPHDLQLGIAARIGDHWIQVGAAVLRHVTISTGQAPLVGRIDHVGHGFDFKISLSAHR